MLSDQTLLIQPPFIYCGLLKLIFLNNFLLLLKAHSILNSVKYKLFYQFPVNVRILQKTLTPFTTSSFILFLSCVDFYIFQTRYIISCFVQSSVFSIYSLIYTFFSSSNSVFPTEIIFLKISCQQFFRRILLQRISSVFVFLKSFSFTFILE